MTREAAPVRPYRCDARRLVERARARAREACAAPENRFGPAFLEEHLAVVAERCADLGPALGADPLALELAAWLHDLAAVERFDRLATHAEDGAALARAWLGTEGCDAACIERARAAIAAHAAPVPEGEGPPEAVALAAGDLLAQLARPAYWDWYLSAVRGLAPAERSGWWRARVGPLFARLPAVARALGEADRARLATRVG